MNYVEEILCESIEDECGLGGLMRFNALYTGGFETADGQPDMAGINAAVNDAFPEKQAAAIVAAVTMKLDRARKSRKKQRAAHAEGEAAEGREGPQVFAKYFNVDPNHVRDIVNEARRLRAAMGKSMPSQWAPHSDRIVMSPDPEAKAPAEAALEKKVTEIKIAVEERATPEAAKHLPGKAPEPAEPTAAVALRPPRVIAEPASAVDEEVRQFVYGRTAYTSIDIMDFIRYLKDKGYSLQDYIVLEKIYVTIEERKKEARFAIQKEIERLIDAIQAPGESDIRGLLRRLCEAGLVFEEEDVRRMIRGAALRRA
jgi:hypothetical protein